MTNPILPNERSSLSLSSYELIPDLKENPSELGSGSFASVRLAREKRTGKYFALKIINLDPAKLSKADLYYIRTEVQIHRQLNHPNVVKFHGYIQEASKLYLVLDLAENGNLYNYIQNKKVLTPNEVFHFFYQTCLAVQYIHQSDVIHRDIKPENILIDKDNNVKLCDFGWSAKSIKDKRTTLCGTYEYMAPEVVWKKAYDYRIDIWSLGILLYELTHGEAPYKGRDLEEITESYRRPTLTFSASIQPEIKDLIQQILRIHPNERISIADILSHSWIKYHLAKQECLRNIASPVEPQAQIPDSSLSPRFKQKFYLGQALAGAKDLKPKNLYLSERELKVQPSQEQYLDYPSVIIGTSAMETSKSQDNSKYILNQLDQVVNKIKNRQIRNVSDEYQFEPISQINVGHTSKDHNYVSATLPKQIAEKWALDARKHSGEMGGKKLFEKDIMSPDFNTKLNSILQQLNVKPSNANMGQRADALSPQSQNVESKFKQNYMNPTYIVKSDNYRENRLNRQAESKENTRNASDVSNIYPENFKVKYNPSHNKTSSRHQINRSHLRLDNIQPQIEMTVNNISTTKVNFAGKIKPETVKASFQKYFAFEAGFSSPKVSEPYLGRTALNNGCDTTSISFLRRQRNNGKANNNGNMNQLLNDSNTQKKQTYKLADNSISYRLLHGGQSMRNKENKLDISREMRNQYITEKLLSQR